MAVVGPKLPRLWRYQWDIATWQAETIVANLGRRVGKSTVGGAICIAGAWHGAQTAWVVPTYKNSLPLWRFAMESVKDIRGTDYCVVSKADKTIEFPRTGGSLSVFTAESADAIRGNAFHVVVLDEAARIAEDVYYDVIMPTLADYSGTVFLLSTPRGKNWYFQLYETGRLMQNWNWVKSFQIPTSASPLPNIRRAAGLAKLRLPEPSYRQEWEAEFVADLFNPFQSEWWEGQNRYDPTEVLPSNAIIARYQSWDTGLKDKDNSAYSACTTVELTAQYRLRVRRVFRNKMAFPFLVSEIEREAREWNLDGRLQGVIIEDKASGTSAYQTLRAQSPPWLAQIVRAYEPKGSKEQRASQAAVWARNNMIELPKPGITVPWLKDFEDEVYSFPYSMYADQVDSFSQIVLFLEHYLAAGLGAGKLLVA